MEPQDSMANRSLQPVRFTEDDAHRIADQFGCVYSPAFVENLNVAADFYFSDNFLQPPLASPSEQRKYLKRIGRASAKLVELLNGAPYLATQLSLVQVYKEENRVYGAFLQELRAELESLSSLCQSAITALPEKLEKYRPKWRASLTLLHLANTYRIGSEEHKATITDYDDKASPFLEFVWEFLQHVDPVRLEKWKNDEGKLKAGFRKAIETQWPTDSSGKGVLLG
jgi:signal transduction histidine kinase